MNQALIKQEINNIKSTKGIFPKWYHREEDTNPDHVYGQAIIGELDSLIAILAGYNKHLDGNVGNNFFIRNKPAGKKYPPSNTVFNIIEGNQKGKQNSEGVLSYRLNMTI